MQVDRRVRGYLVLRGGAALLFLLSSAVLPHGALAGLCVMAAGLIAVFTCIGVNAGGPGERAGSVQQDQYLAGVRAPQGDWPPYAPDRVVEGELVERVD